jgi:hypothetical protein
LLGYGKVKWYMDPNNPNVNPNDNPNVYRPNQSPGQTPDGAPQSYPQPAIPGQNYGYQQPGQPGQNQYGGYGQPQGYSQPPLQPNPYAGYNPNPYPGEVGPAKKGLSKKLVYGIIFSLLGLAIVAVGVVVVINQLDNKPTTSTGTTPPPTNTPDASADVVPRDDGQLDLSTKIDTTSSIKEQTVKAKTQEQVNLSSGFSFMVTKAEAYTSTNPAVKPATGKQFIAVSIAVGNRAKANSLSVSYLDFKLRDTDNSLIASSSVTQEILGNSLSNPTALKPGEQTTGKVVFEVDATDKSWVLIHKETYQKTTDNTTLTVEGDISFNLSTAATPSPAPATNPTTTPSPASSNSH